MVDKVALGRRQCANIVPSYGEGLTMKLPLTLTLFLSVFEVKHL